jgi:hypothetical protein
VRNGRLHFRSAGESRFLASLGMTIGKLGMTIGRFGMTIGKKKTRIVRPLVRPYANLTFTSGPFSRWMLSMKRTLPVR